MAANIFRRAALPSSTYQTFLSKSYTSAAAATATAGKKIMLKNQHLLKKLPVPPLNQTLQKYLRSVEALSTPEDFAETKAYVEEFGKPGGLGEELHQRLLARSDALPQGWLIDWWNDWAYMSYRDPVVINVNYFFQFCDDPNFPTQTGRAASLIQAALAFRDLVVTEELEPESTKEGPLDMSQYTMMFNGCRVPAPGSDKYNFYDQKSNHHILVIRKNKFYTFNSQHPDGTRLSTAEFTKILDEIVKVAGDTADPLPVGALTTENRDYYVKAYEMLLHSPVNKETMVKLESSVFAVCLDDYVPSDHMAVDRALWHGDGRNRFFDKSMQFIVFPNGKAGLNAEHSMMDGTPTNRCTEFILSGLAKGKINHGPEKSDKSLPTIEQLKFETSKELIPMIRTACANFDDLVARHDHYALNFKAFGKNTIKNFKVSPDAFVQMSIQLAYYKMMGVCRATYESAQTKKYLNGRTETNRTVSLESVAWVKSMCNDQVSQTERLNLLKKAIAAQVNYMNSAVDAHGCDRHLLGLRLLCKPNEKPAIFEDKNFKESSHWYLSTSQISSEYYRGYGWGEVVPDGFGVAYMINNEWLNYNIACLKSFSSASKFASYIEKSLMEMKTLCESGVNAKL